jgi:ABC-type dipeptide/oligopeptide/nickel transport system permease component
MIGYLSRRLLVLVPGLVLVSIVTFVMVRTAGGDPASVRLGLRATTEALARLRQEWGLSDPWPVQYWHWFAAAMRGNLGRSFTTGASVTQEILARFPATVELAAAAMIVAIPAGLLAGTVSALHPHTITDNLAMVGGMLGISIPTFWLGILLIIVAAVWLQWLPVSGSFNVHLGVYPLTGFSLIDGYVEAGWPGLWDALRHLVLPALTLAGWPTAVLARHMRSSLLQALHQDYTRTAVAKGLGLLRLVWRHAFPNAMIPVVTVAALETGYLLGGAVITETIFSWPGIGNLTIQAIAQRDYMLVQGGVLLFGVVFAALNLVADVLYAVLDPRIRFN